MKFRGRGLVLCIAGLVALSNISLAEKHGTNDRLEVDITRPVVNNTFSGTFDLEKRNVGGTVKLCPILKVGIGKTYSLRAYVEAGRENECKETIKTLKLCRPGMSCVVKGDLNANEELFVEQISHSGTLDLESKFTRVSEEELQRLGINNTKAFGEAWKDPSGLVWGDVAKNADGTIRTMNHKNAEFYCRTIGARLPTGYPEEENGKNGFPDRDSDFVRLRKYMGAKPKENFFVPDGYAPHFLPNLAKDKNGEPITFSSWSSSDHIEFSSLTYVFTGRDGAVGSGLRSQKDDFTVRCIVD